MTVQCSAETKKMEFDCGRYEMNKDQRIKNQKSNPNWQMNGRTQVDAVPLQAYQYTGSWDNKVTNSSRRFATTEHWISFDHTIELSFNLRL